MSSCIGLTKQNHEENGGEGEEENKQGTDSIELSESDSEHEASSEHEAFHPSVWKRDVRITKVQHIPRLPHSQADKMHEILVAKKDLQEIMLPSEEEGFCGHLGKTCKGYLSVLEWVPRYLADEKKWEMLRLDMIAGITVGVMAIPQSMSYADIAGLQYIYGMYSIFICCFVYAFTGNSRQLGVGPVAMVSLIVEAGLANAMSEDDCPGYFNDNPTGMGQNEYCPEMYNQIVFTTSAIVGIINMFGGFLNLGFLVNFLAHPVVSGFTSGAAIIIGLSQVKYIFGFEIAKSQYVYITIAEIFKNIGKTEPVVFAFGFSWICGLAFSSYAAKNWPSWKWTRPFGPLVFCGAGILICWLAPSLSKDHAVAVIKDIPQGFPPASIQLWDFGRLDDVMGTAISASIIGFLESISIGKALANRHGYKIDAGKEMVALGVTNFIGGIFSCYPVTGSFSRSAVNDATGAQTQLAGLITSILMFLTLLFLTPLFYYLPKFALGAIVINSVKNLIAYDEAIHLWHVKKSDFLIWMTSFIGTLFLGIQLGIGIAVLISMFIVIHETVRPQISVLWRLPHTHVYSNIKTTTHGSFVPGVLVVRIMGSIYFANSSYLQDRLDQYVDEILEEGCDDIKFVVISLSACTSLDTSAIHQIEDIIKDFENRNIQVAFAQIGNRVWKTLVKADVVKHIGEEWFHDTCHDAVQHCLSIDDTHITDEHHYKNLEHEDSRDNTALDIKSFGVHV